MKPLKDLLLPEFHSGTCVTISLEDLIKQNLVVENIHYIILDETLLAQKKKISLKIIILKDTTGDYYLIVEESSSSERWESIVEMSGYFNNRTEFLSTQKRNIILTGEYLDDAVGFLQYYIVAGRSEFKHIVALTKKIIEQVDAYLKS